ncbi:hypothetical protein JKG47_12235 [Acidithiobacillus sp. MC6.1]|nr:hypothetical protein [Acidithiobacillus sp. MC6.1]
MAQPYLLTQESETSSSSTNDADAANSSAYLVMSTPCEHSDHRRRPLAKSAANAVHATPASVGFHSAFQAPGRQQTDCSHWVVSRGLDTDFVIDGLAD